MHLKKIISIINQADAEKHTSTDSTNAILRVPEFREFSESLEIYYEKVLRKLRILKVLRAKSADHARTSTPARRVIPNF